MPSHENGRYRDKKFIFISGLKDAYSDAVHLNPKIDFFLDKTTPSQRDRQARQFSDLRLL